MTLVTLLLLGGVVGLLLFNTSMQQASFATTTLEQQAANLSSREQTLKMELENLRDPQRVAVRAQRLGMVRADTPAFLDLRSGKVLGTPTAATATEPLRILPYPATKPKSLDPPVKVVKVKASRTPRKSNGDTGTTSRNGPTSDGRND